MTASGESRAGVVIAHDVSPTRELQVDRALDVAPDGPLALWRHLIEIGYENARREIASWRGKDPAQGRQRANER